MIVAFWNWLDRYLFGEFSERPGPGAWALRLLRYTYALLRDLSRGQINLYAMGLVYATLLSVVPLVVFAFAILKLFGAARDLAKKGAEAFVAGNHAEALDFMTRAEALVHAPPHLLYIARAQAALGKLVAARETYLKVTREELPASAPRAFKDAQSQAKARHAVQFSRRNTRKRRAR